MIVQHRCQQVVCCADRVEITGKMEVDILHWNDLCISAASCTTFDTKDRSQRRLTKRYSYLFAKTFQSVCQTDRGRGLSFSGWSRVDRGHQNQFSILALGLFQKIVVNLCLIISILLQILLVYACRLCNLTDFQWIRCLCNLNICHHYSCTSLFLRFCLFRKFSHSECYLLYLL